MLVILEAEQELFKMEEMRFFSVTNARQKIPSIAVKEMALFGT